MDYYSRFPEVVFLASMLPLSVTAAIKSCFAPFGIQNVVVSDNGSEFSFTKTATFASVYGFQHATSSPKYSQTNEEVEKMVHTLKDLLLKFGNPHMALIVYRDTLGVTGYGLFHVLLERRFQAKVPKLEQLCLCVFMVIMGMNLWTMGLPNSRMAIIS